MSTIYCNRVFVEFDQIFVLYNYCNKEYLVYFVGFECCFVCLCFTIVQHVLLLDYKFTTYALQNRITLKKKR